MSRRHFSLTYSEWLDINHGTFCLLFCVRRPIV